MSQSSARLAIVTTHPIQYYAPFFRFLAQNCSMQLKVYYTWSQSKAGNTFDRDFGRTIGWDIPLCEGYDYEFIDNVARKPGIDHFLGIDNPLLLNSIEEWKPSAILIIGWNFKSHLSAMRHFKGRLPVLFRGDSTLIDEKPGLRKRLRRIFLTWVYKHIDYALYVGKLNKDYFRAHGLKESQLRFVPHAIDNDRFGEGDGAAIQEAVALRRNLGMGEKDIVFLFAGKMEPKKDPFFMLRLANKLTSKELRFLMVGNGKLEQELKKQAKADSRIIFLDFQNQQRMPVIYRMGDIFVLPSKGPGETWGLAVNEAMASSRPVIVSNKVGCAPDLVQENETGWVFNVGDEGELTMIHLLPEKISDVGLLRDLGRQSLTKVQQYSYKVAANNLMQLMESLN
jgi:glycosyltransferase involved in cell wall biosynthesis